MTMKSLRHLLLHGLIAHAAAAARANAALRFMS
jgi:hypothetical protein